MMSPLLAAAASLLLHGARAYYLPGTAPVEYPTGSPVELKVNKLSSVKTQLPYRYYHLPYCKPPSVHVAAENLGEILLGDMIENSPYQLFMDKNVTCQFLCSVTLTDEDVARFKQMVDEEYQVNWFVDNLPATMPVRRGSQLSFAMGFPVGYKRGADYYVYNHVALTLSYQASPEFEGYRIVGFEVRPESLFSEAKSQADAQCTTLAKDAGSPLVAGSTLTFLYDAKWTRSSVPWGRRYDPYLKSGGAQIHWFSIINSLMVVLFLSGMVAVILLRTLHRDIAHYNEISVDDTAEETGWKLVHGDVFRKPVHSKMLAVSVGTGVQLFLCSCVTLFFSILGFLSPVNRGSILQGGLLLFTFAGSVAGYISARFYKMWKGEDWKKTTLWTAFVYPASVFGIFFVLNLFIWGKRSSGAVPFATMFALLVLWFGISVPLVFLGAFFGYKKPSISLPVRTNQIPRQVPEQPWFIGFAFSSLVGGILPFGAVFTELFFLMSSIWQHQFYYLFGFLILVLCILVLTCAEISITLTYFQLTSEDYTWWWRSFAASATSGLYVFMYAMFYYTTRLQISSFVGSLLYFGYMFILSYTFAILTGTMGFVSSFCFVRGIYGSIKID